MKAWKIAIAITLALSLTLGVTLPGLAASDEEDTAPSPECKVRPGMLRGSVVSVDDDKEFFVVQSGEEEHTIAVDNTTRYFKLTIPWKAVTLAQHRMGLGQLKDWEGVRAGEEAALMRAGNQELAPNQLSRGKGKGILKRQMKLRQLRDQEGAGEGPELMQAETQELAPNWLVLGKGKGIIKHQLGNLMRLRRFGVQATFDDLTPEARVAVWVVPGEEKPVAKVVFIMEPAANNRVIGTITDISSDNKTITIALADGSNDIILNYNEESRFTLRGIIKLEVGQGARAVYDEEMTIKVLFAPVEVPEPAG